MGYEELKIEGRNAVLEAFRSGKTIDKLFVLDGCQDGPVRTIVREAKKHDTIVHFVEKERLDQLSETKKHQGVIAVAAAYEYAEVEDMLKLAEEKGEQIVLLDNEDVSGLIRTPEASMMASKISAIPIVRAYLLDLQRNMAKTHDVIMDGRDIGTVVLPDAQVKIFLTASPEARAERRYKELVEKGMDVKYDDILNDVITRDYNDTHRKTAPLKPAEGCVTVDTTELDFEQSVEKIISVIKENI